MEQFYVSFVLVVDDVSVAQKVVGDVADCIREQGARVVGESLAFESVDDPPKAKPKKAEK